MKKTQDEIIDSLYNQEGEKEYSRVLIKWAMRWWAEQETEELNTFVKKSITKISDLQKEVWMLRDLLQKYAIHKEGCYFYVSEYKCTCGLHSELTKLK